MCGRLSQYRGLHDFADALNMDGVWRNNIDDQALERYNVAPSAQVAVLRMDDAGPRADLLGWGWRSN